MPDRLHKVLARAGVGSRRACEELILAGRVEVAGERAVIGMLVDPERQEIRVDGRKVAPAGELLYFLVYKPKGYVSTVRDPQGRPKVTDLVPCATTARTAGTDRRHSEGRLRTGEPGAEQRLFPVGRLDLQTSGLLILTNDGELTFLLTHPKHDVWKTYQALVAGVPVSGEVERLQRGVLLDDGETAPARVRLIRTLNEGRASLLEISLQEGRKRQVRRMCEAVGHPVIELKRTRLAFLTLAGLHPGQYRRLTADEVRSLKELAMRNRT